MLLRHVETEVTKDMNQNRTSKDINYDLSVVGVVESCILRFGRYVASGICSIGLKRLQTTNLLICSQ